MPLFGLSKTANHRWSYASAGGKSYVTIGKLGGCLCYRCAGQRSDSNTAIVLRSVFCTMLVQCRPNTRRGRFSAKVSTRVEIHTQTQDYYSWGPEDEHQVRTPSHLSTPLVSSSPSVEKSRPRSIFTDVSRAGRDLNISP